MVHRARTAAAAIALLSIGVGASGCSCGPNDEVSLELIGLTNGQTLSGDDDVNAELAGIQIDVGAMAIGLALNETTELRVDGVTLAEANVPSDGIITFPGVTMPSGSHVLTATARDGAITTEPITIFVDDGCFTVGFVTPEPTGGRVSLGPSDDTDGTECGGAFETEVVVSTNAPDGTMARIFVNDMPRRTGTAAGGVVRFEGVGLDLAVDNQISVRVDSGSGAGCPAALFAGTVVVDCDGVQCQIVEPTSDTAFLNLDDDVSDEAGFQGDFVVQTDAEGAGQAVRLVIDGNETDALSSTPSGMRATFGGVDLTEGVHRIRAQCRDGAGNVTQSAAVEWTIDTIPCAVGLDAPTADQVFIDADDLDAATSAIDILASGTAGADCEGLRVGTCSGIGGVSFDDATSSWTSGVALASTATQSVCAETQDEAGNIARASVDIRVNTVAPQLEIATPVDGTNFNIAGDATHTADLTSGNTTCEAAFSVLCTDVGADVVVARPAGATLATAPCVADVGAPSPYMGRATFASVALPSVQDGTQFSVVATQTVDRITGTSVPIALRADCIAPTLLVTRPTCGSVLRPGVQDESADPGFQYRTVVQNGGAQAVTLTIATSGGSTVYTSTDTTGSTPLNFSVAEYGSGGTLAIVATGSDSAGNLGTSAACEVTVADVPSVNITAPLMGAVITGSGTCAAGQIRVTGTTDAAAGSDVDVDVAGTVTSAVTAGGAFDVCATAADGRSVTIIVRVTDTRGTGTGMVTVVIDRAAPTDAIDDLAISAVVDRRDGIVRLGWTGVTDAGGLALTAYELRCAAAAITDEAAWTAANPVMIMTAPSAGAPLHSEAVSELFRVGTTRHCTMRGIDPAGTRTPIGNDVVITLDFVQVTATAGATGLVGLGRSAAAIGDVNGDTFDDVAVGAMNGVALFFGAASGSLPTTPSVAITGPMLLGGAGYRVAGLGDFNGDTRPDFALVGVDDSSGAEVGGTVHVFFGRTSWGTTCLIDAGAGCRQDVTFVGTDPYFDVFNTFGAGMGAAGDFDGDGLMDLAVGDQGAASGVGVVYLILGRSTFAAGSRFELPADTGTAPDAFTATGISGIDFFGGRVNTTGGNVIGDSRHDVVVGSYGTAASAVHVIEGREYLGGPGLVAVPTSSVRLVQSDSPGLLLGITVSAAGDLDGDGALDLVAGLANSGSRGQVRRYLHAAGTFGAPFAIGSGASMADLFGNTIGIARHPSAAIGTIGDLDRDGLADVFAGSVAQTGPGAGGGAFLYYGRTPLVSATLADASATFVGTAGSGRRVAAYPGDLDGDGFADLFIGEPVASRFILLH